MTTKSKQSAIELLLELKNKYAAELSSKLDEIELNILSLDQPGYFPEAIRQIHSMKGSAGTHGFMTITTICHHMEDYLALINPQDIQRKHIDKLLQYIDLLRQATNSVSNHSDDSHHYEKLLEKLHPTANNEFRLLIVDSSKAIPALIRKEIASPKILIKSVEDGYQALGLLLMSKYDLVINSEEIGALNGCALIAAIRNSNTANRNVKIIHLTSGHNKTAPRSALPDYSLNKEASVATQIKNIITDLHNST